MNKLDFILALHGRLENLPQEDVEERLHFYMEMIEDRMEEGLSEEDAVAELGTVEEISAQIIADIPLAKLVKERVKLKTRLHTGEILLLVLGFPVWLPLLISAAAVVLSLYISLWAVLISLWAVLVSVTACAVGCVLAGAVLGFVRGPIGAAVIGAGLVCAGLAIFLFFGCKMATKGTLVMTKKVVLRMKHSFAGKERTAV